MKLFGLPFHCQPLMVGFAWPLLATLEFSTCISWAKPAQRLQLRATGAQGDGSDVLVAELNRMRKYIHDNARRVSLREAIAAGLFSSPLLLEAFAAIQQYEWQLIAAQRRWYPTLQLSNAVPFAGYQWSTFVRQNYGSIGLPRSLASQSGGTQISPGAAVNWNFIDPTRSPNIKAAQQSLSQQKLLFDVSARSLILTIQTNYFGVQSSQQLIESFNQIYLINRQQMDMLEAQKRIGMATVLDLEQTRAQLFAQLNQLVQYTQDYITQAAQLAQALALPDGVLAIPSEPAALQGDWQLTLQDTIQRAKREREEIMASLAAAQAAEWTATAAIRSYLPVFSLVGTGSLSAFKGVQNIPVGQDLAGNTIGTRTLSGAIGLGFTWVPFDGGIQAAQAQVAKAQARQLQAQAAANALDVVQQVRSSYGQLFTAKVALQSAQRSLQSAQLAQEAARARFSVGVGDITSVVQTMNQLSTAAQFVAQATLSYNTAVAQLYRYSATWPEQTQVDAHRSHAQQRPAERFEALTPTVATDSP